MSTTRPVDVAAARERRRRRRLAWIAAVGLGINAVLWARIAAGDPVGLPSVPTVDPLYLMSGAFFALLIFVLIGSTVAAGRSPHTTYRPEQIDVTLADVKGIGPITEEVRRSIDLFRNARTFRTQFGGRARRGLLFEGPPGTGKTHLAKAMAAEAGVPFLFVSGTSFQSMYYGATARKIRSFFTALRKAARAEGGAIAFIEEIDAIATTRGGMGASGMTAAGMGGSAAAGGLGSLGGAATSGFSSSQMVCGGLVGLPSLASPMITSNSVTTEGVGGVVNELLVQMQSFDAPTTGQKVHSAIVDAVNLLLPAGKQLRRPKPEPVDVLVIAATNRADALDPALLRPGRFDRRLSFGLPDKQGRRELIDHFLAKKAHEEPLAQDEYRDALAGVTQGYSPVMIESLMDEALVNTLRRDGRGMDWHDLEQARLVTEVGLGQPVAYTEHEQRLIATHEAGHAVAAWLLAPHRRLEILTIVKRAGALGMLAHGDREDVYTRSKSELEALIGIAFGGQVAEELFFGDISTGPAGDLAYATQVAAQMVGASGMAGSLVSHAAGSTGAFGGDLTGRVMGDNEGRRLMEELLERQKARTTALLSENSHLVEALRDALLDRHELIGHEITGVLEQAVV